MQQSQQLHNWAQSLGWYDNGIDTCKKLWM